MKIKRFAALALALMLIAPGCAPPAGGRKGGKLSVVCTVFPQYDWVRRILGERAGGVELTMLLNSRVDLHSYQPSVDDIVKISACDLFIYVGGASDKWVSDALKEAANENMIVINLLAALGDAAKTEEIIAGMEEDDEDEDELDEHVWLSLKNAELFCGLIAGALSALDADNAAEYKNNLAAYAAELSALDAEYRAAAEAAPVKTLLFGDRFPFRYLADDYGIDCYAAFPGCSAETEASFETIVFLAKTVDKLGLSAVMVTESADRSIAETIVSSTAAKNQRIIALDSMQSVTSSAARAGAAYLSIMESNLNALIEALK